MQRTVETLSLLVLIGVTILRPLVAESYDSSGNSFSVALGDLRDPTPLRTLCFDVLILVGALGWLVARALGPVRRYRWTGLELGAAIVAIAAVTSCFFAGNKRLALNATMDWLCYPVLAITLAQLLDRSVYRRILVAGILASACVQAFYCVEQAWVGFDDTWEHYQSIKEQFWASQGVDLNSGRVESFERRILARESSGVLPHSNVTGSYLVLCGLTALGVMIARWRRCLAIRAQDRTARSAAVGFDKYDLMRWTGAIGATLGTAFVLGAVLLTKSTGAIVSAEVGLAVWLILWGFHAWFLQHRTKAILLGWIAVGCVGSAVVAHGLYHDSLPGVSLTFRWQYWKTSAAMVAEHPLTGVGRENFGRHYLQYKPIESPEEVGNPHNLFIQAASDWGVVGLLGMAVMVIGVSLVVARRPEMETRAGGQPPVTRSRRSWFLWATGLLLVITLGRLPLLGTDDFSFLYYSSMTTGLCWLAGFVCFAFLGRHRFPDRGPGDRAIRTGAVIGLLAFTVHDMINFATFIPGTATTLFALTAFCVSGPSEDDGATRHVSSTSRWLPPAMAGLAIAIVICLGVLPVGRSAASMERARRNARLVAGRPIERQDAYLLYEQAGRADPFDPTPWVRSARWLTAVSELPGQAEQSLRLAFNSLDEAIARDPYHLKLRRMRVDLLRRRATALGHHEDYLAAVSAARDALELYPLDPKGFVLLADCLFDAGHAAGSSDLLREAIQICEHALALDGQRARWEKLRRFRNRERSEIRTKMKLARRALRQTGR